MADTPATMPTAAVRPRLARDKRHGHACPPWQRLMATSTLLSVSTSTALLPSISPSSAATERRRVPRLHITRVAVRPTTAAAGRYSGVVPMACQLAACAVCARGPTPHDPLPPLALAIAPLPPLVSGPGLHWCRQYTARSAPRARFATPLGRAMEATRGGARGARSPHSRLLSPAAGQWAHARTFEAASKIRVGRGLVVEISRRHGAHAHGVTGVWSFTAARRSRRNPSRSRAQS